MNSTTSSEQSLQTFPEQAKKAALARWKLETVTGLLGLRTLQNHQHETEKNLRAENKAVRRKLWQDGNTDEPEESDMGNTILGDVTHPTPVIIAGNQQQSSGLAKTLAGLAIGALIPSAGVGGFLASQLMKSAPVLLPSQVVPQSSTTVIQQTPETESISLGLGQIEDYIKQTENE